MPVDTLAPTKIKFGTDGWRAIIADTFTVTNVARVTLGVVAWLKQENKEHSVVLGHDCRFAGALFTETIAKVLAEHGVKVHVAKGFVTTPMVSFGAREMSASLGIIITASHNPPSYNGYKLKGGFGGPLLDDDIQAVEALIPDEQPLDLGAVDLAALRASGMVADIDLEGMYVEEVERSFDLDAIANSGMKLAYDAMYGSGQRVLPRILPDAKLYRCEYNPHFYGLAPEPIMRNLGGYSEFIQHEGDIDLGLATDGDADRIGLMDGDGNFVDSHHILLLLIHYLYTVKGWRGKVCCGFSSSVKVKQLCDHYGLELDVVKIGFKHICGTMLKEDVLVGGEESGGIAVKGHIPERDGIWNGLVLLEFMAKSGKTLKELVREVYDIVGSFGFHRIDLTLPEAQKQQIVEQCKAGAFAEFGPYKVQRVDTLDGYKYILSDDQWVMIRPSGTEPVLRTYAEGANVSEAKAILEATHKVILG